MIKNRANGSHLIHSDALITKTRTGDLTQVAVLANETIPM
jgi:hypothetical protein